MKSPSLIPISLTSSNIPLFLRTLWKYLNESASWTLIACKILSTNVPVITYEAAGPKDIIDNEIDGIVVNNFEVKVWKDKICKYIVLENEIERMGKNASKKINENYLWNKIGKMYFDEFIKTIESK